MGFINQFPYSDFHEMNLDWLINQTKLLNEQVKQLQDIMAEIEVLTEDQINSMINAAIDANNIDLYNRMVNLKNEITADYIRYCNDQISNLKSYTDNKLGQLTVYVDSQDQYYFQQSKNYSDGILVQANAYTDGKVLDYTMMINPITGVYEDVRNVVDDIVEYFHTDGSLTAQEYDDLELTATVYDAYELTAYDYDFNGKNLLV